MPGVRLIFVVAILCLMTPARAELGTSPVAWQPWNVATFARAKAEGKLLLLDAAAEWCHWCHVMERTTYADREVTALLASRFIAVKVDVDAHPELSERYGDWGWPATIVFSSSMQEIKKMRGYIEPRRFLLILKDAVAEHDRTMGEGPFRVLGAAPQKPAGDLTPARVAALRTRMEAELQNYFDPKGGGWGYRQKSSTWMNVEHALLRHAATGTSYWEFRAHVTLDRLTRIMDPVWGGVYQYSTDGDWEHPHYEKLMTYQAGTLESYVLATLASGKGEYLETARKLHAYLAEFLRAGDGAFLVSQDADLSHPLSGGAPVDGKTFYALPDAARRKLGLPRIDTSVYARENGLAIAAVTLLHSATQDPAHLAQAVRAAERVLASHALRGGVSHAEKSGWRAERVTRRPSRTAGHRSAAAGRTSPAQPAPGALLHLSDNAAFGRSLLALYEATGQARWFDAARTLADAMQRELFDESTGAFFAHSFDPHAVGVLKERRRPVDDNVAAGRFFLRLAVHEDSAARRAIADRALRWLSAGDRPLEMGRFAGAYLSLLEESVVDPLHITVVGRAEDPRTRALLAAAARFPHPRRIVELRDPAARDLRKLELAFPALGHPAAYVCTSGSCSAPITDPARLPGIVRRLTPAPK